VPFDFEGHSHWADVLHRLGRRASGDDPRARRPAGALVALALVQGMVTARSLRLSDERAARAASVRVTGASHPPGSARRPFARTPSPEIAQDAGEYIVTRTFVSLFALIAATPALAQSNSTLPAESGDGEPIVVTATRSGDAIPVSLLGASATVIDAQAIEDRQTRVLSDVLRDVPGIAVSRTGAIGGQTAIRVRGSESNHTLVLIDGIKVADPYAGEFDFGTLLADESARIEILRGQQSALYGSDAIGGVINYITLTGAEAPGMRLRVEGGSFGSINGAARIAGVSNNLDYALSSSYIHTNGYPTAPGGSRKIGADSASLSFKTIWSPTETFHLTAVGRYSYTNAEFNDQDGDSSSPAFGLTVDTPNGAHYRNTAFYGLLRAQIDLLDGRWTNAVTAQITDVKRTNFDIANAFASPAGQPIVPAYGNKGRRLKGSFESTFRFGSDRVKHRVTFALDGETERARTTISLFGASLKPQNTDNVGFVGQYDVVVDDRLALGASVRHDENNRFADPTTYRVQGSYKLDSGTRFHAAAGSGVKAPTFSDLYDFFAGRYIGNPNLKPEKSEGWEIGAEQTFLTDHVTIGATYFDNRLKDVIGTIFSMGALSPVNLPGKTKQRGAELSANAHFGDWRLDASYTYLHGREQRTVLVGGAFTNFNGQPVRRAKNIASANLTWAPADQPFSGTVTVRYNGPQNDLAFTDAVTFTPVLVRLRSFTLVNANATYKLNAHVDLFARVENLLDRRYQEVFSFATPGRAGYGGVKVRF
jgi:vitamin B12 transporter